MRVTILVPVLNERNILSASLDGLADALTAAGPSSFWDVMVVDAGSHDGSRELALERCQRHGWRFVAADLSAPSVGRTIAAGVRAALGEIVLVMPCDTSLPAASLSAFREIVQNGKRCGGFPKAYQPSTKLLRIYAGLQNLIRTKWNRHLVWTNGMFFPRDTAIPTGGFLEDVLLSDELRKSPQWAYVPAPIEVSARRYYPNRVFRRIAVNGTILLLHRLKVIGPERLRRFYLALR